MKTQAVPVEPTDAMILAGAEVKGMIDVYGCVGNADEVWSAMLSAAPAPEGVAVSIWSDARNVFVRYAELFAMTERYEEASAIADKAAREIEALATREEAPAEAGATVEIRFPELNDHLIRMASAGNTGSLAEWCAFLDCLRAALRAQPPAREDAQPFMFAYEDVDKPGEWRAFRHQIKRADGSICPGRPLYTHPAPDALRVAVEALEKIKAVRVCKESANIWTGADACRKIATEALAVLQDGQGAK
ncbi:hypothetical protein [Brevundimonas olei]|uniref:hypothetical protein n=1 Tax=Brevundimonas olei TaxID=657642 RepID=UPI0031DADAAF